MGHGSEYEEEDTWGIEANMRRRIHACTRVNGIGDAVGHGGQSLLPQARVFEKSFDYCALAVISHPQSLHIIHVLDASLSHVRKELLRHHLVQDFVYTNVPES
jgi:hypothetical protein